MPKRSAEYMENQRNRFCDAAISCFRRNGVVASNLTDICEESGLSMGALYKHFSSREDLLRAILERRLNWRNELLQGASWAELKKALLNYRLDADENPFWREFNGVADWNEKLRAVRVQQGSVILTQIEHLLERYMEQGEIDPPFDLKHTTQLLSIIMDGSMVDVRTTPELRVESSNLSAYLDFAVGAKASSKLLGKRASAR